MPFSRRRRSDGPTPLAQIASTSGLELTTRTWMERTVADVAFDSFAFGHDVLCDATPGGGHIALERGQRGDGLTLAVGSIAWPELPPVWIAAQSKRSADHLELDPQIVGPETHVGHERFDLTFDLDVDDDALEVVRSVLTDELCEWAVRFDEEYGPLIVIFDGAEPDSPDTAGHGSAVFVAREVTDDDAFVATLDITRELVSRFRTPGED